MTKIVTHNAKFHTDDVFAVATLFLIFGKENCELIRTRDFSDFGHSDYVVDVGRIYDPERNIFDHHQPGGAGTRSNGIQYASFGLVWKKFGEELSGSPEVADEIDRKLVQSVDAIDNGINICEPLFDYISSFDINSIVNLYRLTWKEEGNWDEKFKECVDWAMQVLDRVIKVTKDAEEAKNVVKEIYKNSNDKRIIIIDEKYDFGREVIMGALVEFLEPIYAILFRGDTGNWQVLAIRKKEGDFESRKALPEKWRGKITPNLESITGVPGSIFCHRSGFMCIALNKEGAVRLAEIALNA